MSFFIRETLEDERGEILYDNTSVYAHDLMDRLEREVTILGKKYVLKYEFSPPIGAEPDDRG